MKKNLFFLLIINLFYLPVSLSQNINSQSNNCLIIKTDMLIPAMGLFLGYYDGSLTFEYGLSYRHSIQLTGVYYHSNRDKIIQIIPQYKFYWNKERDFAGFYSGIYVKFINHKHDSNPLKISTPTAIISNYKYDQDNLCVGVMSGYQKQISKRINIDFLLGIGVRKIMQTTTILENDKYSGYPSQVEFPGKYPSAKDFRGAINIGYRF